MKVSVQGLRKTFRAQKEQDVHAVNNISLDVHDGEFLVVLGPSGSGKTTLLRCIAGLERPDAGEIRIGDRLVFSSAERVFVPPERRGISMVFQSYALWPHMTAFVNVAYSLRARHTPKNEIKERVQRALDLVGCGGLANRYPSQLSGGQQQRIAVARAIVNGSQFILFDEPLSSVDARVREELRRELGTLQATLGFSAIYITHDLVEATVLGHRVAVIDNGEIAQIATPRDLYERPQSVPVAEFMGATNRQTGVVEEIGSRSAVVRSKLGSMTVSLVAEEDLVIGQTVNLICRPEYLRLSRDQPSDGTNAWRCTVDAEDFVGICTEYRVHVGDSVLLVRSTTSLYLKEGETAWVAIDPKSICLLAQKEAAN